MVKELRDMTGAGMMECKKALVEAEGDMDKAVDILRTRGLAAAAKKAGRATNEGTIMTVISEDGKSAAILELNCETDFVAENETFLGYARRITTAALNARPADVEALKAADADGETVDAVLTDAIHTIGENTRIKRFEVVDADAITTYIHAGGKIGVLVQFELDGIDPNNEEFAQYGHDVAMQVAAAAPVAANREDVPEDVRAHEMEIYKTQAAESGKPANIQEKIATGRMEKYYKEFVLAEQAFVKDSDQTIGQYTEKVAKDLGGTIKLAGFVRYVLGE